MKKTLPLMAVLSGLIACLILALSLNSSPLEAADLKNGAAKYNANCAVCHGKFGHGDGVAAAAMSKKPANINKKLSSLFSSQAKLTKKVLAGKTGMPAFKGVLSEQEISDIFGYIRSVNL